MKNIWKTILLNPISKKISCNNIINPLRTNDVNTGNEPEATSSNKVSSFNPDRFSGQKGNFQVVCQNNNNLIVNGDINNEQQNNPTISACNTVFQPENPSVENSFNNVNGSASAFNAQTVCTENNFTQILDANLPIGEYWFWCDSKFYF